MIILKSKNDREILGHLKSKQVGTKKIQIMITRLFILYVGNIHINNKTYAYLVTERRRNIIIKIKTFGLPFGALAILNIYDGLKLRTRTHMDETVGLEGHGVETRPDQTTTGSHSSQIGWFRFVFGGAFWFV